LGIKYSLIKLINGVDIISELREDDGKEILINPMALHLISEAGLTAVELYSYSAFVDEIPMFSKLHVLLHVAAPIKLVEIYKQYLSDSESDIIETEKYDYFKTNTNIPSTVH